MKHRGIYIVAIHKLYTPLSLEGERLGEGV